MEEDNPGLPRWAQEPDEASPLYSEGGRGRGVRRAYEDADEEEEEGSYSGSEYDSGDDDQHLRASYVNRGCVLNTFLAINVFTILVALGNVIAQVLVLVYTTSLHIESVAIRCYGIIFCLSAICAELDWTRSINEMALLNNWISRGFVYAFIGLLTLEEENEVGVPRGAVDVFIWLISWMIVFIGALYFIMQIRDKKMTRYRTLQAHMEVAQALAVEEIA